MEGHHDEGVAGVADGGGKRGGCVEGGGDLRLGVSKCLQERICSENSFLNPEY